MWKAKLEGKSVGAPTIVSLGLKRRFVGTILGIDPSLRGTGLAVVEFRRPDYPVLLRSETVSIKPNVSMPQCLGQINLAVARLLKTYPINVVALEQTIYVQNFQTAQILGAARGAAIAAAAVRDLPVFEYAPLRVKQAVVGHGRASKPQVAKTVKGMLGHGDVLKLDESDAAAVALCHAFTGGTEG